MSAFNDQLSTLLLIERWDWREQTHNSLSLGPELASASAHFPTTAVSCAYLTLHSFGTDRPPHGKKAAVERALWKVWSSAPAEGLDHCNESCVCTSVSTALDQLKSRIHICKLLQFLAFFAIFKGQRCFLCKLVWSSCYSRQWVHCNQLLLPWLMSTCGLDSIRISRGKIKSTSSSLLKRDKASPIHLLPWNETLQERHVSHELLFGQSGNKQWRKIENSLVENRNGLEAPRLPLASPMFG